MELPSGSTENWYYIDTDDEKQGPVPYGDLKQLSDGQKIFQNTYIWNAVLMKDWAPYSEVLEAFPQLSAIAPPVVEAPPDLDLPPPPDDYSAPPADDFTSAPPPDDFGAPPPSFDMPGPPPVMEAPPMEDSTLDKPQMDELDYALADLKQQTGTQGEDEPPPDVAPLAAAMGAPPMMEPPSMGPPSMDPPSMDPPSMTAPVMDPPSMAAPDFVDPSTEDDAHRMSVYQAPGGGTTYEVDSEDTKTKVRGRVVNRMAPYANEAADSQLQHLRKRQDGTDQGDVKRRGYLMKQGGSWKNWNKRWMVLRRNTIYYYKKERDHNPAGDILLEGATVEPSERVTQKPYSFRVRRPDRQSYYIQAANMPEMEGWIEAIKEAIGPNGLHPTISATAGRRYHDGFLKKQGGSHKNWRRRWCHMSKWFFYYFKHQQDQVPTGSIPLADFTAESASQKESSATYCIRYLTTPLTTHHSRLRAITRDFLFSAEDAEDRSMWLTGFAQGLRDQRTDAAQETTIRNYTGRAALLYDVLLTHPQRDGYCLDVSVFGCEWTIQAHYAHLHALHQQLCRAFPGVVFPNLPPTEGDEVYTKHTETADRERVVREAWLQCYMREITENYEVSQHPAILRFLDLTNVFRAIREGLFHYVRYLIDELQIPLNQRDKEGATLLHASVLGGQHDITRFLLERGVSLRDEDSEQRTPLLCGVQAGQTAIVKTLKEFGASVNTPDKHGTTPLLAAATLGHNELVEFLITAHANTSERNKKERTALHCAIAERHVDTVKLLLESMQFAVGVADDRGFTPLHEAVEVGDDAIVELILGANAEVDLPADDKQMRLRMPLHISALSTEPSCVSIASRLIAAGSNLASQDADGSTPLHLAAWKGTVDMCKLLIKSGAPINFSDISEEHNVCTPLHLACNRGDIVLVNTLVGLGANVHSRDAPDSEAPLHVAAAKGYADLVDILLDHEADTEVRQVAGQTPLHLAVIAKQTDVVQRLLERGAYPNALDVENASPLYYACNIAPKEGGYDIALMLARWGAMPTLQSNGGKTPMTLCQPNMAQDLHEAAMEGVKRVQEMQKEAVQKHRQQSLLSVYHHPAGDEDAADDSTRINIETIHSIDELMQEIKGSFGSGAVALKYSTRERVRITDGTTIDELRGHASAIHVYPVKHVVIDPAIVARNEERMVDEGVFDTEAPPLEAPPPPPM